VRWVGQPAPRLLPPRPVPAPKRRGCLIVLGVLLGSSTLCCCLGSMLMVAGAEGSQGWDPIDAVAGPEVELGAARVPSDLAAGSERNYRWRNGKRYGLGYGLSSQVHETVDADHAGLAKRFSYHSTGSGQFTWIPPSGCQPQPWSCVFNETAAKSTDNIAPLTELFRQQQLRASLDARALTELVVTFVQNIQYRLPTETYFELLPPELVVADGSGDCDSKALLAGMILKELGVETAMLYSRSLAHAALGVALPGTGTSFAHQRVKYLFVEVTYPGWAIGTIPPQYDKPKQWEVLPLR
jgi:hypothetical protein